MKLLFCRHGDPNYELDCLTEKGHVEAEKLAELLKDVPIDRIYISPQGRAQQTAAYTLRAKKMSGETVPLLHEFEYGIPDPVDGRMRNTWEYLWDYMPGTASDPRFYHPDEWRNMEIFHGSAMPENYDKVMEVFDGILARHGVERTENGYRMESDTGETIAIFSHQGVATAIFSHLLHLSPLPLFYHVYIQPSSVTILDTEPCHNGVRFVMRAWGALEHLNAIKNGLI